MAIKNIIFDLGGVVLNLDQGKTLRAFKRLGGDLDALNESSTLFLDFEIGKIDADTFLNKLGTELKGAADKEQIRQAWNAMLLDLPASRIELLKAMKKKYRLFLLSNTNSIHMDQIFGEHGKELFHDLFEKVYLSHEIGMRKPNLECYQHVLNDAGIKASETIFIDDSRINIRGAEAAGITSIQAMEPLDNWILHTLRQMQPLKIV